jgi:copper(I)-binding protein
VHALLRKLTFTLVIASTPAMAGGMTVSDAWIRAMPAHLPAAGYFTLHNSSASEVTLTGAESASCSMLMLHKSTTDNGMATMMDMPSVAVPPGGSVKFAPGGFHLMCTDPSGQVKPGSRIEVTLQFAGAKPLTVTFAVRDARGK